jgi:DNA-binding CsgD family transcriptional regulator/tetratricopeptide (TPR) repeat protein
MQVWDAPPLAGRGAGRAKPTFVGRAAELASADQSWAAVSSGVRELIFVGGEPGAGKSRFVEEIAAALHLSGAVVLVGTCSPEPGPPYEPFVECLEQLLGWTAEGALADCLPDSARELLRLTPLVRRHRPDLQLRADDDRDYRRELFDALASLLRSVSQVRPVVCVLEDLHWAGTPTLQLLSYVAQRSARTRLMLLCTHRTTAPDRTDELTYAIADLYRLDGVRRIDLPGLSADEIAQYLVADGGLSARRAREYAAVLRDQTGGNPFFLRETWRDVIDRGAISRRPFAESAPVSIRETLQRRLAGLAPSEREVLETAAVLGDGGDLRTLIAACDGDAGAVLSALDAAARFGFVDAEELARGRALFPHTLIRQAVLDLVNPSRRILLHARIGDVLQSAGLDSPQVVLQVAYHFARARALGYGGKAAEYFVLSAREAERSLAFEDAAAWYAQAADLSTGSEGECDEMRFSAARSHVRAGDFASAMDLYRLLTAARDPTMRLRAAIGYEEAAARPGTPGADACGLLNAALDGVPADEDDADYVRALASLGRAMALTGAADRARVLGEHALGCARRLGDERLLLHALRTMMIHVREPESLGTCLATATEVARLAGDCEDWDGLGESATFRAAIAYLSADPIAWADALADMELAGRKTGQPFGRYLRGCNDYAQAFLRGDFAAAERIAEDLLEVGRSFGPDDTEGPYGLQMYMVRRETGALEALRPLVDVIGKTEYAWEPGLLALYTELGMAGPARRMLRRLIAGLDDAPARQSAWAQWTAVLVFLVEAALALRDAEAARRLRPMLAPLGGLQLMAGQFVAVFGPADAYLAALDSLLGDGASADRLFERALAQSDRLGSVVHRAAILAAWSAHLRSRGDTSRRYEDMRDEAGRLVARTGQVRLARLLEQDALGHPAGLTAREVDVLRLLARGSSNRDIAHELRITENTAANHVRSLLIKTRAANRTQLAMIAVARHWVDDNAAEFAP